MKIGIDVHGTITKHRSFFVEWTQMLRQDNIRLQSFKDDTARFNLTAANPYPYSINLHEVHIMTGPKFEKLTPGILDGIWYSHFFSIVGDCEKRGHEVQWDAKGEPHVKPIVWDLAKANYAYEHKLDLVIDDSQSYGKYFTTPYAMFQPGIQ